MADFNTQILIAFINFGAMVIILYKLLYKPIMGMLKSRQDEILALKVQTESKALEATQKHDYFQQQVEQTRQEAQQIIIKAQQASEETTKVMCKQGKEEAANLINAARDEISLEIEKAKVELRKEVAELAILATGNLVNQAIQPKDQSKLIEDFIQEIGQPQ